jgi:hypothetical protein
MASPKRVLRCQAGDWLSQIAQQYYGDAMKYDVIHRANIAVIGPDASIPSSRIRGLESRIFETAGQSQARSNKKEAAFSAASFYLTNCAAAYAAFGANSVRTFCIHTDEFTRRPLSSNLTKPSISAKSVSSLPRPTLLPGFHLVPLLAGQDIAARGRAGRRIS